MNQKTQKPTSVSNFLEKHRGPAAYDQSDTNSAKSATPPPLQLSIDSENDIEDEHKNKGSEDRSSKNQRETDSSPPEKPMTPKSNSIHDYLSNTLLTSNAKYNVPAVQRFSELNLPAPKKETDVNSTRLPFSTGVQQSITASRAFTAFQLKSSSESTIESKRQIGEQNPIQFFFHPNNKRQKSK